MPFVWQYSSSGHVRWFVLEGQPEGNDTTLFTIVCGLHETEYGYTSANEMESCKCGWLQIMEWTRFLQQLTA